MTCVYCWWCYSNISHFCYHQKLERQKFGLKLQCLTKTNFKKKAKWYDFFLFVISNSVWSIINCNHKSNQKQNFSSSKLQQSLSVSNFIAKIFKIPSFVCNFCSFVKFFIFPLTLQIIFWFSPLTEELLRSKKSDFLLWASLQTPPYIFIKIIINPKINAIQKITLKIMVNAILFFVVLST